ncbi:MAG: ABC-F family ATP-binding cassette domain-containing protein [Rhodospirillaceae bacterium]|nr:ABC-F family ATP-binding cassette domain-containing protein [Rhodospirillaceae bacterium]
MSSISLNRVSVLTPHPLFQDINVTFGTGDRVGLVAGNGAGKSTLLRCLAGMAEPTTGTIIRSRGLRIGFVEQDVPERLLNLGFAESLRRAIPPDERAARGWQVDLLLGQLEVPDEFVERPLHALSGGWQRLALIAQSWIKEPDLLLLDEPTNHLDLEKIRLLEDWIAADARDTIMVIASHDRQFLDACTNQTLFLRPEQSRLYAHPFSRARQLLGEDDSAQAATFARLDREAARLRQSAGELRNIGINSRSEAAQKKSAQMARRAQQIEQGLRPVPKEKSGDIRLATRSTHARVMMRLDAVAVTAPDGKSLFRTEKLAIVQGDRAVILGRNGVGKSQFINLLRRAFDGIGETPGIQVSPAITMGYLDQQMSQLPSARSPQDFIGETFRLGDQRSRTLLASAGFPVVQQDRPIARLSAGQRARLGLLALRLAEPNFYLMDEPTNHLDIDGQERLEAEILARDTTCILISHDRHFVETIATRYFLIEKGRLREIEAAGRPAWS